MTNNERIKKIRLDVYLHENGYFDSREKARIAIMEGKVFVNSQKEDKPGTMIKNDSEIIVKGEKLKYVSRGGYKLEKAVDKFNINLDGKECVDIGSSTGGFTDCMLKNGAKIVFAVDCGTNQLDYKLRTDKRVIVKENTNARYIDKNILLDGTTIDDINISFISVDVSFISLTKIIPVILKILTDGGRAVMLIKPQFEAGKELVEKNGVVKDKKVHMDVINKVIDFCEENGFKILGLEYSPIKGPAGNIEYLIYVEKNIDSATYKYDKEQVKNIVEVSHLEL